jgi:hypothetical protein
MYPDLHPAVMPSMIVPRAPRLVAAAVLLHVLSGCYRYVPTDGAATLAVPAGAEVRLYLTPQGMTALEPRLGPRTAAVVGRVGDAGDAGDGVVNLVVSETRKTDGGAPVRWIGERVAIPTASIARVERRTLDRRRTVLAGALAALAAGATFAILATLGGGGDGEDGGGGVVPTP